MHTEHEQNTDVQSLDTKSQQKYINVHRTWTKHRCSVSWHYITTKVYQCTQNMNRTQMFSLLTLNHNKSLSMYTEHEQNTDVQSLDTISQQKYINVHRTWTEHRCSVSWYYITTKVYQCTQNMNRTQRFSLISLTASQQLLLSEADTWCGGKVMRLATLCMNRQRCCLPLHMAVRLTPAIDSVQVWTCYSCYAIVKRVWSEVVFVRCVTKTDQQKFEQSCAIKFCVKLG